jgi:hypothetical protein
MTEKVLLPKPRLQFLDADGNPAAGYKVFTYEAGTTTKVTTWTDDTGLTANTNPIILDANGECDIWVPPIEPEIINPIPPGPPGPQGPPGPPGPPGASGNATELSTIVDVDSQTIYGALFGSYTELAPNSDPTVALIPTMIVVNYHYRAIPYATNSGTFQFAWGPPISPFDFAIIPDVILENTHDAVQVVMTFDTTTFATILDTFDIAGKPLTVTIDTAVTGPSILSMVINIPGTGYAVNDTGIIDGGDGNATYKITAESGGVPSAVLLTNGGTGYSTAGAATTTLGGGQPGSGTGLTLHIYSSDDLAGTLRFTTYYRSLALKGD